MTEQRRNHSYSKSEALLQRAKNVIPNGIPGHFNPMAQVPAGTYPHYVDRAKGSRCLLYTSPSPRDKRQSRMPSSA